MRIGLYIDAARQARASQILGRGRRLVPPRLLAAGVSAPSDPEFRGVAGALAVSPAPAHGDAPAPSRDGEFAAFGWRRRFDPTSFWDGGEALLFQFHLHGFTRLAEYAAGARSAREDRFWAEVVGTWLERFERPTRLAWHPYPTSIRIGAWSAALSSINGWPADLTRSMRQSLWRQAAYLRRSVEWDIGGNHVLKNATALVFAGAVLPASPFMRAGSDLLCRELERQILGDGGHEERSTSYHRDVHADLTDVIELVRRSGGGSSGRFEEVAERMRLWSEALAGPDRRLPLLNDAWAGPPVGGGRPQRPVVHLGATGHVVLRHRDDQVVFDAGPLAPGHLPAHAHADALSLVLWADRRQLLVDPGSYAYSGPERDSFRCTLAHNTVEVDREDQCVFWGDFRASALPQVRPATVRREGALVVVSAAHDGYRRLSAPVTHERTLVWWPEAGLVVLDRLVGEGMHSVRFRLHCAPGLEPTGPDRIGPFHAAFFGQPEVTVVPDGTSPYLGEREPARSLEAVLEAEPGEVFGWSLLRPGARATLTAPDELLLQRGDERTAVRPF